MAERFAIVEKTLVKMLEDKKYTTLRDILATMNPSDIAGIFGGLGNTAFAVASRTVVATVVKYDHAGSSGLID